MNKPPIHRKNYMRFAEDNAHGDDAYYNPLTGEKYKYKYGYGDLLSVPWQEKDAYEKERRQRDRDIEKSKKNFTRITAPQQFMPYMSAALNVLRTRRALNIKPGEKADISKHINKKTLDAFRVYKDIDKEETKILDDLLIMLEQIDQLAA